MTLVADAAGPAVQGSTSRFNVRPEVWIPLVLLTWALGYPFFLLVTSAFNVGDPQTLPAVEYGFDNFVHLSDHLDWIGNTLIVACGGTGLGITIGVVLAWGIYRTTMPGTRVFR